VSLTELLSIAVSCLFFMAVVAWFSYRRARHSTQDTEGYFLAGRGLSAVFIAGSLLLTNLSAEQLIGLNGSAYGFNMSAMGWEVTAAVATVAMAFFFLPRYLRGDGLCRVMRQWRFSHSYKACKCRCSRCLIANRFRQTHFGAKMAATCKEVTNLSFTSVTYCF